MLLPNHYGGLKVMKKFISLLLAMVLILSVGCGNDSGDKPEGEDKGSKNTKDAIVIKYGLISPESHSSAKAAVKFGEYIEEESDGELKLEVYPNALLGGDVQMTEAVALGSLHMALPATSTLVMYAPEFGALDLPFIFKDDDNAFNALEGDVGEFYNKELEKVGIKNLVYNSNGSRCITNNVRPIEVPDDLKGVKMRVMESPVFIDMFTYLGTNPTPISFGELFTALQQKTVDGQENAPTLIYDSKFQEVQEYFSETNHVYSFCANIINQDFYDGLSDEHQAIIDEGAKKWLGEWQIEEETSNHQAYIEKLKEDGMKVNTITPENHEKFVDQVSPMYEKYEKELGKEIFELLDKYK